MSKYLINDQTPKRRITLCSTKDALNARILILTFTAKNFLLSFDLPFSTIDDAITIDETANIKRRGRKKKFKILLISKYLKHQNIKEILMFFLDSKRLNPSITFEEAGLFNNSSILVYDVTQMVGG